MACASIVTGQLLSTDNALRKFLEDLRIPGFAIRVSELLRPLVKFLLMTFSKKL